MLGQHVGRPDCVTPYKSKVNPEAQYLDFLTYSYVSSQGTAVLTKSYLNGVHPANIHLIYGGHARAHRPVTNLLFHKLIFLLSWHFIFMVNL